jgi:hypothetical protein
MAFKREELTMEMLEYIFEVHNKESILLSVN